ncbi:MAG TPA: BamA/TamA family outer membrane protein [Polyangiales bacterium]
MASFALAACATIPKGRYGVDELTLRGTNQIDPYALRACLATHEREWLSINLSKDPAPTCGKPPFDARRLHLNLWRWPWSEWPLYDPSIFERDLSRIERWYRARGYYGVRILDARSRPEVALYGSQSDTDKISLDVSIDEGQPVLIQGVQLQGADDLPFALRRELTKLLQDLPVGQRFDEADYDLMQERLLRTLRDDGYAQALIAGNVEVDPKAKSAQILFKITSGPIMEVGDVCVEGHGKLPAKLILQASDLRPGRPFSQSDIEDARTRVYQLRVLSEVEIVAGRVDPKTGASRFDDDTQEGEWLAWRSDGQPSTEKDPDAESTVRVCRLAKRGQKGKRPQIPIEIRVKPGKLYRFGVGAGLQIGVEDGQRAISAAQQWDVHVFAYAEVQNFLGGLRRLRIEERPKLIFLAPFPRLEDSEGRRDIRLGNNLSTLLEWPAFLEARTLLRFVASWDRGPDPYGGRFIRDDFNIGLGPSRGFLKNRLNASVMVYLNPYIPRSVYGTTDAGSTTVLSDERYDLLFLQQVLEWDTRDDKASARKGTYARVELQETLPPSSWGYVRAAPEVRQYIALPYGLVLAGRFGIGWLGIYNTEARTEELRRLGPRPYRLRGGGPYSVRGIQAGELGMRNEHDGYFPGGTRSWIASLELRIPLGDSFGIATFMDVGDVDGGSSTQKARFRFDHPNTTVGAGLRYKTIVGPIRLDVGVLIPGLQGPRGDDDQVNHDDPLFNFGGAVHLTVGEAF